MESGPVSQVRVSPPVHQRLMPWLRDRINSGRFPGLRWENRAAGIFRIPWRHMNKPSWSEKDVLILKEWEINAGRYVEGKVDYPSAKARFRNALNRSPDFKELKNQRCEEEPDPHRVFQFTDRQALRDLSGLSPQTATVDQPGFQTLLYPALSPPPINTFNFENAMGSLALSPVMTAPEQKEATEADLDVQMTSLSSDLQKISMKDLVVCTNLSLGTVSIDSSISGVASMETDSFKSGGYQQNKISTADTLPQNEANTDCQFSLIVRFQEEVILKHHVTNRHGCRITDGKTPQQIILSESHVDFDADQIVVSYDEAELKELLQHPACDLTYQILQALELGVNIFVHAGNIYILRRCKSSVFAAPPNTATEQAMKIERDHIPVKIFDYQNAFLPALSRYQEGLGPRPSSHVIVAFSQPFCTDTEPYRKLLFSVTVRHAIADSLLDKLSALSSC